MAGSGVLAHRRGEPFEFFVKLGNQIRELSDLFFGRYFVEGIDLLQVLDFDPRVSDVIVIQHFRNERMASESLADNDLMTVLFDFDIVLVFDVLVAKRPFVDFQNVVDVFVRIDRTRGVLRQDIRLSNPCKECRKLLRTFRSQPNAWPAEKLRVLSFVVLWLACLESTAFEPHVKQV